MKYQIVVNNQMFEIVIGDIKDGIAQVNVNGIPYEVLIENYAEVVSGAPASQPAALHIAAPPPVTPTTPAAPKVSTTAPTPKPVPEAAAPAKPAAAAAPSPRKAAGKGDIIAPIPGRITSIKVNEGDAVNVGQTVATMEAMKMENNIASTADGIVQEIRVQKDSEVATGQVIMVIG